MGALFACFPLIHVVLGILFLVIPEKFGHANNQPPRCPKNCPKILTSLGGYALITSNLE
jgi:hypothetical protein